jgi:O-antigen ligase
MQPILPINQNRSSWRMSFIFISLAIVIGSAIGIFIAKFNNPIYILLGLVGLVAFIGTIASVEFGLLFLVFITYARVSDIAVHFHNAPSVAQAFIVLLILAILIRWVVFNEKPVGWQLPAILLGIYGLIGFASVAYAENTTEVIYKLSNYVKDAIIALVIVALMKRPPILRHVTWSLLTAGIFMGTLSVFQYITGTFTSNYGGFAQAEFMNIAGATNDYRLSGPIGDPNFYAQIMLVLVPIALERMLHEQKPVLKIIAGWAAVVSILTVVFTFSRGGFIGLMVALIIFAFLNPPRPVDVVFAIALGVGLLFFIPSSYYDRVLTLNSLLPGQNGEGINVRQDNAIQGRASQALTAWSMIKQYPLLGVGLNNFSSRYQEFSKEIGLAPSASARSLHNLYLEVATETGILGFSAFFMIIWLAVRSIINARRIFLETSNDDYANLTIGLAAGFGGYLMAAFFVHSAYPRQYYLLIGIVFSLPLIAEQLRAALNGNKAQGSIYYDDKRT